MQISQESLCLLDNISGPPSTQNHKGPTQPMIILEKE